MTETKNAKKKFISWTEPPEDYVRKFKGQEYIQRLGDKLKGSDFLDGFIQDICKKDRGYGGMSPSVEKWLAKIECTFIKELETKPKNFGEGSGGFDDGLDDELTPEKIPF